MRTSTEDIARPTASFQAGTQYNFWSELPGTVSHFKLGSPQGSQSDFLEQSGKGSVRISWNVIERSQNRYRKSLWERTCRTSSTLYNGGSLHKGWCGRESSSKKDNEELHLCFCGRLNVVAQRVFWWCISGWTSLESQEFSSCNGQWSVPWKKK